MTDTSVAQETAPSPGKSAPAVSRGRRWLLIAILAGAGWLAGTLLQITVRDQIPGILSAMFYAAPMPLVVLGGSITWFALKRRLCVRGDEPRQSRLLRAVRLIVLAQAVLWVTDAVGLGYVAGMKSSTRILFWNVNRGFRGYDGIAEEIMEYQAEVVALAEATEGGQLAETWRQRCPGYTVATSGSGMVFLVRGSIEILETGRSGIVSRWRLARVKGKSQPFLLLLIDVTSHPLRSRQPAFDDVVALLNRYPNEPFVIAGDFNTPTNSVRYEELRTICRNSFEVAGNGLRETWPVVLPVLALDQLWGNKRINWQACEHGWSARSDHRPVVAEFIIENE